MIVVWLVGDYVLLYYVKRNVTLKVTTLRSAYTLNHC